MQLLKSQSPLNAAERGQKRKLVMKDSLALVSLLVITLALFTATLFLFRSFTDLRSRLAKRWLARGEAAMQSGHPELAVEDLRSALAYSPGQRSIEIELAEALAGAGRTQEATSYFNTLWEAEPGSGIINLQLARLAATQNDQSQALEHYHASIYGNWEGDGSVRRREVRIELIDYLIGTHRYDQARAELLIVSGNAPDDPAIKLKIASLMEKAGDAANALRLYKTILQHGPPNLQALEGAGRSAFAQGNFVQARDYLHRALARSDANSHSAQDRQDIDDLADEAVQVLLLYPSPALSARAQAERVLRDRSLILDRVHACGLPGPGEPSAEMMSSEMSDALKEWTSIPDWSKLTVQELQRDEDLRNAVIQSVYETVRAADKACGEPTGENALLSKIAANPGAVEAQ